VETDIGAERARALIMLRAVLDTVAERLDQDSADLDDLGLLVRISELKDLVDQDLQRIAQRRKQQTLS
jgi:hypothetical protein